MAPTVSRAVGAIVRHGDAFLLVHKTKMMNAKAGAETIAPRWDFPKGGVKPQDPTLKDAVLRELVEETGSSSYTVIKEFREKIRFEFPPDVQEKLGYCAQETTMFLVEFSGDPQALQPQDEEIDPVRFMPRNEVEHHIVFKDSLSFFQRHT